MLSKIKTSFNKYNKLTKTIDSNKSNLVFSELIKSNSLLVIASNTDLIKSILEKNKFNKIFLIVYNNLYINEFILLKKRYPYIEIYFIGNNIDFTFYSTILAICKNYKFNNIIIDNDLSINKNHNEYLVICGYLLCQEVLNTNGVYMQYLLCPNNDNLLLLKLLNILYDSFNNKKLTDYYCNKKNIYRTLFVFNDYIKTGKFKDLFINILKNYYNEESNLNNFDYNLNEKFLLDIYNIWNVIINDLKLKETKKTGGELTFQRIKFGFEPDLKKIPILVDDLPIVKEPEEYIIDKLDLQPRCHWGQKKLLLSEIQFLTRIAKNLKITSFKDYALVYAGAAGGHHLPILYKMFPDLLWLLYDPAPFSPNVYTHPTGLVKVYNRFFVDETLEHVKENCENRKIIFISDIRISNDEVSTIKDMRNQGYWGMELDAVFMLFKFKLPYNDKDEIPRSNNDLKYDVNKLVNPLFKTDKPRHMVYLKGDIYLQLFPPPYSTELRLFVQRKKNKYEFVEYNYSDIQDRLFKYNSDYRTQFICNEKICKNIPTNYLNLIPGFDTGIECLMEYNVYKDFYNYFEKIDDDIKLINKIYDINLLLEKITNRKFYNCLISAIKHYYKGKTKYGAYENKNLNKIKLWERVIRVKINLNVKAQMEYTRVYGKKVLGNNKYNYCMNNYKSIYDDKYLFCKY